MLCLALDGYDEAVIIDPAMPSSFDTVLDAWGTNCFRPGETTACSESSTNIFTEM